MAVRIGVAAEGAAAALRVAGRLDAEGAQQLSQQLEELLGDGLRELLIDLTEATYISTPALLLLQRRAADLATLRGELRLIAIAPPIVAALADAGLRDRLLPLEDDHETAGTTAWRPRLAPDATYDAWRAPSAEVSRGRYEVTNLGATEGVTLTLVGDPADALGAPRGRPRPVAFGPGAFGLGIGAIGTNPDDARRRAGELLALPGIVTTTPTDGARVPDTLIGTERSPAAVLVTGLCAQGTFSHLVRFQPQADSDGVPLRELLLVALDVTGADAVAVAAACDVRGLVTAARRQPPAAHGGPAGLTPRAVAEWLSFSPEPGWAGNTALLVGVVGREPRQALAAHLRPLGAGGTVGAHVHAALLPARPLPRRSVSLRDLAARLLETSRLRAVTHVVFDPSAPPTEPGPNVLRRGLLWVAPVTRVEVAA